jgi:hypothetical protein
MISSLLRRIVAAAVAVGSGILLLIALSRSHKVYDADAAAIGLRSFTTIGERQLVIDTTFSGVRRIGNALHSTYDRSTPRGKRACPT